MLVLWVWICAGQGDGGFEGGVNIFCCWDVLMAQKNIGRRKERANRGVGAV